MKEFDLLKFATMLKDSENLGTRDITIANDPRILPFGKILRKTKINELPQLINILFGDMSVVGPRPLVMNTFKQYDGGSQKIISSVKPGLSGIGSIFFRDEEVFLKDHSDPRKFYFEHISPYKSALEVWFVQNNSIIIYFKVIIATIIMVIFLHLNHLKPF